jgi:hypothetical protein
MEKQYCVANKPVQVILSLPVDPDFLGKLVWFKIFKISIRASINNGYFILSGVPKIKL